jgi:competence protein ComEC
MASLIATGALAPRVIPRAWRGWKRTIAREALTSVVASAVTAPLVAWQIGRLSLIAPLTNLVAAPIMGMTQPALFLALAFAWARPIGRTFAASAHPMLWALDRVAAVGASVPGASIAVTPGDAVAVCAAVAAVAAVVACVSRWPARPAMVMLLALVGCVWWPAPGATSSGLATSGSGGLELHVIDVGQGDALAMRTPHGQWVVMDAGREWPGGDAGARTVVPYLKRHGAERVALFVLSHAHADHVGGAAEVVSRLGADEIWDGAWVGPTPGYRRLLDEARTKRIAWHRVHPGDSRIIDSVEFTVLAPDSTWVTEQQDANEASVVLRVRYGAVSMLLTGDAEGGEESWLRDHADTALRADVLKVGHHGSRTSTTPALLDAVQPRLAVISVGRINKYGHPNAGTLSALARAGAQVLRTDRSGSIVVITDGHRLSVRTDDDRFSLP